MFESSSLTSYGRVASATTLLVKGHQEMVFRQFQGLFPDMLIRSMLYTNLHVAWWNFPALNITVRLFKITPASDSFSNLAAVVSHNQTQPLSTPGREVQPTWEEPGSKVANDYKTEDNLTVVIMNILRHAFHN
ncbi:hypothetical protein BDQ12DRAFT_754747 [Crucibulum laeve]|uniref:Uncharacterized protein n=1 Tax=Crucibulum laeve TaxID=68775 RepID=A0A5C3LV19_9AGAR|nr:hypothetical protein BDQ12DRAFT_754747 [Crucibulum laeve]